MAVSLFNLDIVTSWLPAVDLKSSTVNNRELLFFLISRRSRYRAGTRYFTRGIDINGYTANNNETEQIVLFDPLPANGQNASRGRVDGREKLSYVQTRGSVPVFWAEVNNLRYKPDLQIMDIPETVSCRSPAARPSWCLAISNEATPSPTNSNLSIRLPRQSGKSQRPRTTRKRSIRKSNPRCPRFRSHHCRKSPLFIFRFPYWMS